MKKPWKEQTLSEKIGSVVQASVFIALLVILIIAIMNPDDYQVSLWALPLFGLYQLIESIRLWKKDRDAAFVSMVSVLIALVGTISFII